MGKILAIGVLDTFSYWEEIEAEGTPILFF